MPVIITDGKDIEHYFSVLQKKQGTIEKNMRYAYGDNYEINAAKATPAPDNRIITPLAKSTITDVVGYSGKPGELKTEYLVKDQDGEAQTDDLTDLLRDFDEHNKEGIENSELLVKSLSLGIAWELWWVSNDLNLPNGVMTPEYKILDNRECVPVYDNSLKPKLEAFLRYSCVGEDEICDVYYPLYSEQWKKIDGWVRHAEGDTNYPYISVPVIPFRTSMNNMPIFEAQKTLIDTYDKIVSKSQNEVDRFNAVITLFPGKVDAEFIAKLTEFSKPYIDDLDQFDPSTWPKYLEKNLGGVQSFYESHGNRVKNDYYETIKVPNFMDQNFAGGDQSGLAVAFKLMGLEFLVSEIEIYFRQGLNGRFLLYQDIINASTWSTVEWDLYEQVVIWNRNLPVDAEAKLKVAAMLKALGYSARGINNFIPSSIIDEEIEEEIIEPLERDEEIIES